MSEGVEGLLRGLSDRELDLLRKEREIAERERSIASLEEQVELRLLEIEAIRSAVEKRIEVLPLDIHHQADLAIGGQSAAEHEHHIVDFLALPFIGVRFVVGDEPRGALDDDV